MNAKQFTTAFKALAKKYNLKSVPLYDGDVRYEMDTIYGKWRFTAGYSGNQKIAHFHTRFETISLKDLLSFKNNFWDSFDRLPNFHSGKWNFYYQDPEFMLDFIEEQIENMLFLLQDEKDKIEFPY